MPKQFSMFLAGALLMSASTASGQDPVSHAEKFSSVVKLLVSASAAEAHGFDITNRDDKDMNRLDDF